MPIDCAASSLPRKAVGHRPIVHRRISVTTPAMAGPTQGAGPAPGDTRQADAAVARQRPGAMPWWRLNAAAKENSDA
jgi:hypothetical protein